MLERKAPKNDKYKIFAGLSVLVMREILQSSFLDALQTKVQENKRRDHSDSLITKDRSLLQ